MSSDYLHSTLENGGFITEGCEAGSIFKKGGKYYLLTDYTCCFCTQGSGVRVYVSDHPMSGYRLTGNINRYPGTPAPGLIGGGMTPNVYSIIKRQADSDFAAVQMDLSGPVPLTGLKIFQFIGNRSGVCGDTLAAKATADIAIPEFQVFVQKNGEWTAVEVKKRIEQTSVYNIISLDAGNLSSSCILLKAVRGYPYNEIFLNKIELMGGAIRPDASVFINDVLPGTASPIIPAQQTGVLSLKTTAGMQYIWMGDLWGSAGDNIKGHDYQYWGAPLNFDANGNIQPMKWTDTWKLALLE